MQKLITTLMNNKYVFIILQVIHFFLAITILSGLFYIRLIPRVSRDLWEHMTYSQTLTVLFNIMLILINMFLLIKYFKVLNQTSASSAFLQKLIIFFSLVFDYLKTTLKFLYNFVIYILEYISRKFFSKRALKANTFRKLSKKILALNKDTIFWTLMGINCIPKFIFVFAFCYDVVYANHLHYTFKSIPLLLIPLLEPLLIFLFQDFYDSSWDRVSSVIVEIQVEGATLSGYTYSPYYRENPPQNVKDFHDFFYNHFMVYVNLKKLLDEYAIWKYEIFGYIQVCIILCSLRLFALLYLLFYGII